MGNSFGLDITDASGEELPAIEAARYHGLVDVLALTPSGRYLLYEARESDLVIVVDETFREAFWCMPKMPPSDLPMLLINPAEVRKKILERFGIIEPDEAERIFDNLILSYVAHELRHNVQHEEFGALNYRRRTVRGFINHGQCAEADAYGWQHIVETELNDLGLCPGIFDDMDIVTPKRREIGRLAQTMPSGDGGMLANATAAFFMRHEAMFERYMNSRLDIINDYVRQRPFEVRRDIPLSRIANNIFTTRNNVSYMDADKLKELLEYAYDHVPQALKEKLARGEIEDSILKPDREFL